MPSDRLSADMTATPKEYEQAKDIGSILRQSREKQSISISELARELHLPLKIIEALEQNRFEIIPVPAYTRGYIRNYAKATGLDAQQLIDRFNSLDMLKEPEIQPYPVQASGLDIFSQLRPKQVLWTISLVLVSALIWWIVQPNEQPDWLVQLSDEEIPAAETLMLEAESTNTQLKPAKFRTLESHQSTAQFTIPSLDNSPGEFPVNAAPSQPMMGVQVDAQTESRDEFAKLTNEVQAGLEASLRGIGDQPAPTSTGLFKVASSPDRELADSVRARLASSTVTRTGNIDQLQLSYKYNSWTEVRDADNKLLLHGLVPKGETRTLDGIAPFGVFLGNSPGDNLLINGQQFDQASFNQRNNTARFSVSKPALLY